MYLLLFFFEFLSLSLFSDVNLGGGRLKSSVAERLEEYFREVLESCIGLDVAGDPVQSRLSLSGLHDEEIIRMAVAVGVRRFSVSMQTFGGADGTLAIVPSLDDCSLLKYKDPSLQYMKSILST